MENRRHLRPQGGRTRLRHRQTQVFLRHEVAGHVAWQGPRGPPRLGQDWFPLTPRPPKRWRASRWCTTETFVGAVAPDSCTAEYAVNAITAQWSPPPADLPTDKTIFDYLKNNVLAGGGRGGGGRRGGGGAPFVEDESSRKPFLPPRPAPPIIRSSKLTRWPTSPTPRWNRAPLWPIGSRTNSPSGPEHSAPLVCAPNSPSALGIPEERVRVIVPDTGSGYGGKHTDEAAIEAARLSRAAGKPVKVVWTREEEFTRAFFRPAAVIEVTSGVSNDGKLTSWEFANYNPGNRRHQQPLPFPIKPPSLATPAPRWPRLPIAPWPPPPTISPAKSTWTNWRAC